MWTLCGCIVNMGEWTLCGCIVNGMYIVYCDNKGE